MYDSRAGWRWDYQRIKKLFGLKGLKYAFGEGSTKPVKLSSNQCIVKYRVTQKKCLS